MNRISTKNIALAGLFLALGLTLPFLTGQIPQIGSRLLPMHIPILLCGFICGWPIGLVIGLITPLLRSLLFGAPPMYPIAIAMAFELATYGALTGLLYKLLPRKTLSIYVSLVAAMIGGRVIWGAAQMILLGLDGKAFTWAAFAAGGFVNALPGIILQIILIPVLLIALKKAKLIES
jgi:thiamine transporter ThiT